MPFEPISSFEPIKEDEKVSSFTPIKQEPVSSFEPIKVSAEAKSSFEPISTEPEVNPLVNAYNALKRKGSKFASGFKAATVTTPGKLTNLIREYGERSDSQSLLDPMDQDVEFEVLGKKIRMTPQWGVGTSLPGIGYTIMQEAKDLAGRLDLPGFDKKGFVKAAEEGRAQWDEIVKDYAKNRPELFERGEGADAFLYDLGGGASSLASAVLISLAAGRNPKVGAAVFGLLQKASKYEEQREAGRDPSTAGQLSSAYGTVEGVLEEWGLTQILKRGNNLLGKVVVNYITEASEEMGQEFGSNALDILTGLDDPSMEKLFRGVLRAGAIGGILGAGMGGSLHVADQTVGKFLENNGMSREDAKKFTKRVMGKVLPAFVKHKDSYINEWLENSQLKAVKEEEVSFLNKPIKSYKDLTNIVSHLSENEQIKKQFDKGTGIKTRYLVIDDDIAPGTGILGGICFRNTTTNTLTLQDLLSGVTPVWRKAIAQQDTIIHPGQTVIVVAQYTSDSARNLIRTILESRLKEGMFKLREGKTAKRKSLSDSDVNTLREAWRRILEIEDGGIPENEAEAKRLNEEHTELQESIVDIMDDSNIVDYIYDDKSHKIDEHLKGAFDRASTELSHRAKQRKEASGGQTIEDVVEDALNPTGVVVHEMVHRLDTIEKATQKSRDEGKKVKGGHILAVKGELGYEHGSYKMTDTLLNQPFELMRAQLLQVLGHIKKGVVDVDILNSAWRVNYTNKGSEVAVKEIMRGEELIRKLAHGDIVLMDSPAQVEDEAIKLEVLTDKQMREAEERAVKEGPKNITDEQLEGLEELRAPETLPAYVKNVVKMINSIKGSLDMAGLQNVLQMVGGRDIWEHGNILSGVLTDVKNKIIKHLDVESVFNNMHYVNVFGQVQRAQKTGFFLKTYVSAIDAAQSLAIKTAISLAPKGALSDEDWFTLFFVAQYVQDDGTVDEEYMHEWTKERWETLKYKPHVKEAAVKAHKIFEQYKNKLSDKIPQFKGFFENLSEQTELEMEKLQKEIDAITDKDGVTEQNMNQLSAMESNMMDLRKKSMMYAKLKYVHIPIRHFLTQAFEGGKVLGGSSSILSASFSHIKGRKTIHIEDLLDREVEGPKMIKDPVSGMSQREKKPLLNAQSADIRRVLAEYITYVETQLAQLRIKKAMTSEGVAIPRKSTLKHFTTDVKGRTIEWVRMDDVKYPAFKGMFVKREAADMLEDYFEHETTLGIGKFFAIMKMWRFANPLFMAYYDIHQAWSLGTLQNINKDPKSWGMSMAENGNWATAIREVWEKGDIYRKAVTDGLASVPYIQPWDNFEESMNGMLAEADISPNNQIFDTLLRRVKAFKGSKGILGTLYTASWNTAWHLDKVVRMHSYLVLQEQGYSSKNAAQLAARAHGDYASVPPRMRRRLNKFFFTPTFEIVMNKYHYEALKSAVSLVNKTIKGETPTNKEKRLATALLWILAYQLGKNMLYKSYGFKAEQFSRRYVKEIETDEGPRELVLTHSSPLVLWNKYYHGFVKYDPTESRYKRFAKYIETRVHPVWNVTRECIDNQGRNFKPVRNNFDAPETQALDTARYFVEESITMLGFAIKKVEQDPDANKALKAYYDNLGYAWGSFMRPNTFRYIRNAGDQRAASSVRALDREFQRYLRMEAKGGINVPAKVRNTRLNNFRTRVEQILDKYNVNRKNR